MQVSGKAVLMYKSVGVRFADFTSLFLNILWKWNNLVSPRPNYFIFMGYFKTRGREGIQANPLNPTGSATEVKNGPCYKWIVLILLQRNYRKKTIKWSFSYNFFVKFHGMKIWKPQHDHVIYPHPCYSAVHWFFYLRTLHLLLIIFALGCKIFISASPRMQ